MTHLKITGMTLRLVRGARQGSAWKTADRATAACSRAQWCPSAPCKGQQRKLAIEAGTSPDALTAAVAGLGYGQR
jgi:hypothetical protein